MGKFIESHKNFWKNKQFIVSFLLGMAFLVASLIVNYYAGIYATKEASNYVTDILLDNLPVYNMSLVFIQGSSLFFLFIVVVLFLKPKRLPFVIKASALFVIIRSIFVIMTHIGPFPGQIPFTYSRLLEKITFGGDLFFSGHTGLPFLMALIFWQNKKLRYTFLIISAVFAVSVILGHLHYSIDVFAAFFITYTIFVISRKYFKRDYSLLLEEDSR